MKQVKWFHWVHGCKGIAQEDVLYSLIKLFTSIDHVVIWFLWLFKDVTLFDIPTHCSLFLHATKY